MNEISIFTKVQEVDGVWSCSPTFFHRLKEENAILEAEKTSIGHGFDAVFFD
jgi:hypothetical protein